jgi:hypothetical protein
MGLVARELQHRWERAVQAQDQLMGSGESDGRSPARGLSAVSTPGPRAEGKE